LGGSALVAGSQQEDRPSHLRRQRSSFGRDLAGHPFDRAGVEPPITTASLCRKTAGGDPLAYGVGADSKPSRRS
jgi:hypothetical protein